MSWGQVDDRQDWYFIHIDLPYEVFKFDFVFMDKGSGVFDNNNQKVRRTQCGSFACASCSLL